MSSKSGYSVQIACPNLLSCLNGHTLAACHCSFQREDSINLISIVSVGYHVTMGYKMAVVFDPASPRRKFKFHREQIILLDLLFLAIIN